MVGKAHVQHQHKHQTCVLPVPRGVRDGLNGTFDAPRDVSLCVAFTSHALYWLAACSAAFTATFQCVSRQTHA